MKQDFPAISFSLPTLFTVEDIINFYFLYHILYHLPDMAHRLFCLHLDWRKKKMIGYWLTEELGYPILKIIIFIHADVNIKLYLQ